MWNRAELKQQAKENFRSNYGLSVLMAFLATIATGGYQVVINVKNVGNLDPDSLSSLTSGIQTGGLVETLLNILLFAPALIGITHYFIKNSLQQEAKFDSLFHAFRNGNYGNVVLTLFLKKIYIALWTLLFIIPGIVKGYSYFMVDYILAENPTLDNKRAFEISKATMQGEKFNVFVLDLSFILWGIATVFTLGILGILYVNPYKHATNANLYKVLRTKALDAGYATADELPGFYPTEY